MKTNVSTFATAVAVSAMAVTAAADVVDRPVGFKIGERMTLRPYVSLSYTYDSNVDSTRHSKAGSSWVVNPGIGAEYKGDNWEIAGRAWYRYHAYHNYSSQLNSSSFGENVNFKWANSLANEKGWSLLLSESFTQVSQDDDWSDVGKGRGLGRDRKTVQAAGVLERRINEYWHAAVDASYYMLDYDNNVKKYAPMYGWKRTTAGGEAGFMASKWTDIILAANYQWYQMDNAKTTRYADDSKGWNVMGGFGTRATERISYRLLAGWSHFEYAGGGKGVNGGDKEVDGWTYQLSGKWKLADTWNTMLLAASYYQPSEYEVGSAIRVDSISWGIAHSMIRRKLAATFDINYRHETHEYSDDWRNDYDSDYITARIGLTYTLNRFLQVFGRVEYQTRMCDGGGLGKGGVGTHDYDYDRFRGTVGMRLTY